VLTFAKKPKRIQQTGSPRAVVPARLRLRDINSILHLQRTSGSQSMQRTSEPNAVDQERRSASIADVGMRHDFSQIRVYPHDHAQIGTEAIGAHPNTTGMRLTSRCLDSKVCKVYKTNSVDHKAHPAIHRMHSSAHGSQGAGSEPSEQFTSSMPETAPPTPQPRQADERTELDGIAIPAAPLGLRWQHIKRHRWDALWFFCGEHPSGFSTTSTLRAEGYMNPNNVEWFVRQGADKVYAPDGFVGPEITLHSSAGSQRAGDVHIEVQERLPDGTVTSYLGQFTVRKPHHLLQRWTSDHASCPPWDPSPATCPSIWSEISYRVVDNVGGTIVGATVNERFPGPVVNDQPNHWAGAPMTAGSSWPNTNGTFIDNLYKCCGIPAPVAVSSPNWGDKVYHEPQEFFVGSSVSGRGCRVQVHRLQFYRGYADHENIRSPAP